MSKKKLLIIEDEPALLKALITKFKKEKDIAVLSSKNGEEGLAVALKEHPNLILLDVVMPRMDGMTMLGLLRKDKWGKDANVIILTNLDNGDDIASVINKGAHDYLVKADWSLDNIVKKVKEKLK